MLDETDRVEKLALAIGFTAEALSIAEGATYMVDGAVACWHPPGAYMPKEDYKRFVELLSSRCTRRELRRLAALGAALTEHKPEEPHWTLSTIATVPAQRGQGRGKRLLEATLPIVDDSGLPAILESTNPRNHSLYLRHGFQITGEIPLPDGPSLTVMRRPPAE